MKGYLSQRKIPFETKDIGSDETAERELVEMGFTAVPVTIVGSGAPILGSNFQAIDQALSS